MSRIDQSGAPSTAWPEQAHEEVGQLRRAITEHLHEATLPAEVAAMMGEFLAQPALFAPVNTTRLAAPSHTPDPGQLRGALLNARAQLSERAGLAGPEAPALQAVLQILDEHLELKAELIARCAGDVARVG
ncbi:hypothetical protein DL240_01505 [Lujinxingia litoralis]|uniref:Uncharacterized protein n=1 Tax=Lujinxingia litoralis TaxID=2211119 RepID=A0A328C9X0_9DELT|nr:hypothetical protein [Lujinxingia litoralis]RAL24912.1 hypothetical protein DL240_01505 [Lujinxingia litoralis]